MNLWEFQRNSEKFREILLKFSALIANNFSANCLRTIFVRKKSVSSDRKVKCCLLEIIVDIRQRTLFRFAANSAAWYYSVNRFTRSAIQSNWCGRENSTGQPNKKVCCSFVLASCRQIFGWQSTAIRDQAVGPGKLTAAKLSGCSSDWMSWTNGMIASVSYSSSLRL